MHFKNVGVLVLLFCGVFQCAIATGILLNILKNTVQNTRCKIHNVGSKIIHHSHHQGDPCAQAESGNEEYVVPGNNDYGYNDHQANNYFGSSGYENNNFGSSGKISNGYQVNENLDGDRQYGYGNQQNFYNEKQQPIYNGHSYGSSNLNKPVQNSGNFGFASSTIGYQPTINTNKNEISKDEKQQQPIYNGHSYGSSNLNRPVQNSGNFGFASSTNGYQPTINTNKNEISKGSSNEGIGNIGQEGYNENSGNQNNVENPNKSNPPVDNFLPENSSENYNSTSKISNNNKTLDALIKDIFGNSPDNNIDSVQENNGFKKTEVTSENYPVTIEIDIRGGPNKKYSTTTYADKTYASVPQDGGRNIIKVSCPAGKTPTDSGECLEEFN